MKEIFNALVIIIHNWFSVVVHYYTSNFNEICQVSPWPVPSTFGFVVVVPTHTHILWTLDNNDHHDVAICLFGTLMEFLNNG